MRVHNGVARLVSLLPFLVTPLLTGATTARDAQSSDPDIRAIVTAVVQAYGGEEALRAIRGYHIKGEQRAAQTGATIRVERWFARPDRLRLELAYPDHHETRFTDGAKGWVGSGTDDLRPAHDLKLQAMRLQTVRLDLPMRLLEYESQLKSRDADDDGRIVLRLPLDSGLVIDYHIDPKTHRIERVEMQMPGPPEMLFGADYGQFHMIKGVLIPFHEVTFAGSTITSTFQATEFQWNPEDLEARVRPDGKVWN